MSNRDIPRAFVIGWPIAHSRSPLVHHYWLKTLGLEGSYERIAVAPEGLADFLQNFPKQGFVGGNVTLPHKAGAAALCTQKTAGASLLQAVNTVWINQGKLCGDNTDIDGFLSSLDADAPGWDKACGKAVLLGAGGAARAILYALMSRGVARVSVINRSRARSEDLLALGQRIDPHKTIELYDFAALPDQLKDADLLVNTTSLGMEKQPELAIDLAPLPSHALVADIVYVPLETALLRAARARSLKTSPGLGMLLHQAVPGFERWFGRRPEVTPELRALIERDIEARD